MNEALKQLAMDYKRSSDQKKKNEILDKIRFSEKTKRDFPDLLDLAKEKNLDLEFYKMVIDCFFETPFDRFPLASIHRRLEGRVFENYFIGCLQRKNMGFKFLESLYSDLVEDSGLSKIIMNIMVTTACSLDNFLFLLIQEKLSKEQETKLLVEMKRHNGCLNFWIRALERAKVNSSLQIYSENLLRQKLTRRNFYGVYELYMDNPNTKAASLILEIMADMAKTESEVDKVLYLSAKDHVAFDTAMKKKGKFIAED
jgi:hypothetical protein